MKKVNFAFVAVLLSASVGASTVFAQTPPEPPKGERGDRAQKMHERLKAADKDGDAKSVALKQSHCRVLPNTSTRSIPIKTVSSREKN